MSACVSYGCTNRPSKKIPGVTFHLFPLNEERKSQWIRAIRRVNWQPSKRSLLCSHHFTDDLFDRSSPLRVRLKDHAVPTKFKTFPSYLQGNHKLSTSQSSVASSTTFDCLQADTKSNELHTPSSSHYSGDIKQEIESVPLEESNTSVSEESDTQTSTELSIANNSNQVSYENRWPALPGTIYCGQKYMFKMLGNTDKEQDQLTSDEIYLKRKIDDLNNVLNSKNKQIKILQQKVRRYTKRIENFNALFQILKDQKIIDDEDLQVLKHVANKKRKSTINSDDLEVSETELEVNDEVFC